MLPDTGWQVHQRYIKTDSKHYAWSQTSTLLIAMPETNLARIIGASPALARSLRNDPLAAIRDLEAKTGTKLVGADPEDIELLVSLTDEELRTLNNIAKKARDLGKTADDTGNFYY